MTLDAGMWEDRYFERREREERDKPTTHEFVTHDGIRCIHCSGYPSDLLHWTI